MKHLLMVVVALFAVSQSNAAVSDARLSYVIGPKGRVAGAKTTTLTVDARGNVSTEVCQAVYPKPCSTTQVKVLSHREMNIINSLIEDARNGEIVTRTSGSFHCLAIGFEQKTLTADNGKVFLSRSDVICPSKFIVNTTAAASELVIKLEALYDVYTSHLPIQ